jgi:hypothetical protein
VSVSRNEASATQSERVSCTPCRYDSCNLYLDDITITPGINKQGLKKQEVRMTVEEMRVVVAPRT